MRCVTACFSILVLIAQSAVADTRCFDDNRFCFTIEPADQGYSLSLQRGIALPVVVTVYASQLPTHHVTHFLDNDQPRGLGTLQSPATFWRTMRVRWTPGVLDAKHNDAIRYTPPLRPIEQYPIVQGYNGRFSHSGSSRYALDFAADVGTPVIAARSGIVLDVKASSKLGGPSEKYADLANYVALLHSDGTTGEYYHLKYQGVTVARGDYVERGALIGYSGNTGFSSVPHLHFGVYRAREHGRFESVRIRYTPPLVSQDTP